MGSKRIKVLHVFKTSFPETIGGIEVVIDTLCRTTCALGVENTVFALAKHPEKNQPISFNGYDIFQCKENLHIASTGFSLSAFPAFSRLVDQADLIHYHFPNPFADILHFFYRVKKPSIITYHSDIIKQKNLIHIYRPLMNRFLTSADCLVATSPQYLDTSPVLQRFKKKTRVIPIGLDKSHYPNPDPHRLAYWKKQLPKKFFLFIGAFRYYKGLFLALDALKKTDFHLVVAGFGHIEQKLKAHSHSLGLNRVHFPGRISPADKSALLHLCHAFVFPSFLRSEAFGISLLESAMYGKPAISAEIGTGTSFINIHKKTGLVIPPEDSDALCQAMKQLYHDESQADLLGKNAAERFNRLFTADKQATAYATLYRELLT